MSKPPEGVIWEAPEHTLAKIAILRAYLQAWFTILGKTVPRDMLYIDGFAGPGSYAGDRDGSPIVAVKAAHAAHGFAGKDWRAKTIRMVFVESDKQRFETLRMQLAACRKDSSIAIQCMNGEFASAFNDIKRLHQDAFTSSMPIFAFLDPFGVKGIPFRIVRDILASKTSEAFLLLDTDGMERIRSAGKSAGHEKILNNVFGGEKWRDLAYTDDAKSNGQKLLAAYRQQLRDDAGAEFTFPFEMRNANGTISHHLLFATKHLKGLEKMKGAMRSINKNFIFTDGQSGQDFLFGPDDPAVIRRDAEIYFNDRFKGCQLSYNEIASWILQETPYMSAERILDEISRRGGVELHGVAGKTANRARRAVPWREIGTITFRERLVPPETGLFDQE